MSSHDFASGKKMIRFTLVDENNKTLNLNGSNMSLTIILYKEIDYLDKLNNIGKLLISINDMLNVILNSFSSFLSIVSSKFFSNRTI